MNEENFVKESIQKDLHARITEKKNNYVVVEKSFENLDKFLIAKNNKKTVDLLKNWQDRGLNKIEKSKTLVDKNSMLANSDQIISSSLLFKNKNFEYKLNYELNIDILNKIIIIENNIKRNNYLKTLDLYRSKKFFQSEKLSKIKKNSAENATMNRFASILESIEKNKVKSVNKCENNSLNGESILSLDDEKNRNIEKKIVEKTIIKDEVSNFNNNINNNINNNNNRKQSVIKLNDANVNHETEFKNIFKNYQNLNLLENNANFFNVFKCLRENIFKNFEIFEIWKSFIILEFATSYLTKKENFLNNNNDDEYLKTVLKNFQLQNHFIVAKTFNENIINNDQQQDFSVIQTILLCEMFIPGSARSVFFIWFQLIKNYLEKNGRVVQYDDERLLSFNEKNGDKNSFKNVLNNWSKLSFFIDIKNGTNLTNQQPFYTVKKKNNFLNANQNSHEYCMDKKDFENWELVLLNATEFKVRHQNFVFIHHLRDFLQHKKNSKKCFLTSSSATSLQSFKLKNNLMDLIEHNTHQKQNLRFFNNNNLDNIKK
jgi:hypothetical protein